MGADDNPLARACALDFRQAFNAGQPSLWNTIVPALQDSLKDREALLDRYPDRIARARRDLGEIGVARLAVEQERFRGETQQAAEDLGFIAMLRDERLGTISEDAQLAEQTAARLLAAREVLIRQNRLAAQAALEQQEQSAARQAKLDAHRQALAAQAPEMFDLVRQMWAGSRGMSAEMRRRLEAVVAAVAPTIPDGVYCFPSNSVLASCYEVD